MNEGTEVRKKKRKHESNHEPRNGRTKASTKKEMEARKPRVNKGTEARKK